MTETIFVSPHSTDWHRKIAEENTILLSEVGSGLHGVTVTETDDIDEMGICIPPRDVELGIGPLGNTLFEQYESRTQPMGQRSGSGDIDHVVYSLRKFARLAGNGNPTVLMILFSPRDKLHTLTPIGASLRDRRSIFLSKDCGRRFEGYLARQRKRMIGELSQRTNRPELVEKYGYDTKFAYHALRLAIQGTELMKTGTIELPMADHDRRFLGEVRHGVHSKEYVLRHLDHLTLCLQDASDEADLPEHADFEWISKAVADWHERSWQS
jgi:predicted nucleotidyltransferase